MAGILLRSPVYKTATAGAGTFSTKCTITLDGTLRYTLVKSTSAGATILWEIAELCRDYIETNPTLRPVGTFLPVVTVVTSHVATDGSGAAVATTTFTDVGYDGYGTFLEGSNPSVSADGTAPPGWLVSGKSPNEGTNNYFYSYVPTGAIGWIPYIDASSELYYQQYTTSNDESTPIALAGSYNMNFIRIDCTKYGTGNRILFTNKFGALQEIWFFLKEVNATSRKQETFQRNIISSTGTYSTIEHTKKVYNTTATNTLTLSSGYYPEWANDWFEQLMLSESVWLINSAIGVNPTSANYIPLNVNKSSMTRKTSLNNRLIEYEFDFDMSYDYINNIR
mgnify:FL=1